MKKIGDKTYKSEIRKIDRKISGLEREIAELHYQKFILSCKHNHKGPMTLTGKLNKKMGFKRIERCCRLCGRDFITPF